MTGLTNVLVKRESLNPTGSFKARGMAVAVSRAVELGAKRLVAPSAGNAAGALAAYAAAAGVPATLIMPTDAPLANQIEVLVAGGDLILLDGLISDCARLGRVIADQLGAFDLSTLKEPYRVEGKKTMGFELAEQLGWRLPDAIVYPTGGGTGLIGMWKAFDELEAMGLIGPERPRMFSVQVEGCAPIVRAFNDGQRFAAPWENAATAAAGLRVPAAIGDFLMLDCIRASKGAAISVSEQELRPTQMRLSSAGLGYASLETAAAVAALPLLLEQRRIDRNDQVVVFDTGAGFKSEPPSGLGLPVPVANDPSRWDEIISKRAAN
jgi:threonine synthase